jgi:hypothetical protein
MSAQRHAEAPHAVHSSDPREEVRARSASCAAWPSAKPLPTVGRRALPRSRGIRKGKASPSLCGGAGGGIGLVAMPLPGTPPGGLTPTGGNRGPESPPPFSKALRLTCFTQWPVTHPATSHSTKRQYGNPRNSVRAPFATPAIRERATRRLVIVGRDLVSRRGRTQGPALHVSASLIYFAKGICLRAPFVAGYVGFVLRL